MLSNLIINCFIILIKHMHESKILNYTYNNVDFKVWIIYKRRLKYLHFRYNPDNLTFKVTCPYCTSNKYVFKNLEDFAPKLIKKMGPSKPKPINGNKVYIFGIERPIVLGKYNLLHDDYLEIKDYKLLNKVLRELLMDYLKKEVNRYENIMGTPLHQIQIRKTTNIFASNYTQKHKLSFSFSLIHYSPYLIESVIMHELAHDKHANHSKDFYNHLKGYSRDYKECHKALCQKDYSYGVYYLTH